VSALVSEIEQDVWATAKKGMARIISQFEDDFRTKSGAVLTSVTTLTSKVQRLEHKVTELAHFHSTCPCQRAASNLEESEGMFSTDLAMIHKQPTSTDSLTCIGHSARVRGERRGVVHAEDRTELLTRQSSYINAGDYLDETSSSIRAYAMKVRSQTASLRIFLDNRLHSMETSHSDQLTSLTRRILALEHELGGSMSRGEEPLTPGAYTELRELSEYLRDDDKERETF
jgi:hypothetical protein